MPRKTFRLDEEYEGKFEEYRDSRGLTNKGAIHRLIEQGIQHETEPDLTEALARESLMLSAFSTLLLALFSTIAPSLLPFGILSFAFMLAVISVRVIGRTKQIITLRDHIRAVIAR